MSQYSYNSKKAQSMSILCAVKLKLIRKEFQRQVALVLE